MTSLKDAPIAHSAQACPSLARLQQGKVFERALKREATGREDDDIGVGGQGRVGVEIEA
jgi:hypothetical protein